MKRVIMIFFACVLAIQSSWAQQAASSGQAQLFSPMKDFTLFDRKGNEHKPSEFKGKYTVLLFTGQDCESCGEAMTILDGFYNRNKDKVEVVTISLDDKDGWSGEASKGSFNEWNGNSSANDIASYFGSTSLSLPFFVIIHPNGNILHISKNRLGSFFKELNEQVPDAEIDNILKSHKK